MKILSDAKKKILNFVNPSDGLKHGGSTRSKFTLSKMPPEGHEDVGKFFGMLYERGVAEIDRQNMHQRWYANYVISRSKQNQILPGIIGAITKQSVSSSLSMGLIGANIERTVANITARAPVASAQSDSGNTDLGNAMTSIVEAWNSDEIPQDTLSLGCRIQETYGTLIEKAVFDPDKQSLTPIPLDIAAFIPCPGKYHNIQDMPYCCHHYMEDVDLICETFGLPENNSLLASEDELKSAFLTTREDLVVHSNMAGSGIGGAPSATSARSISSSIDGSLENKALVVEVWARDMSRDKDGNAVYPGGIRLVVLAKGGSGGYTVLFDGKNPNVNLELSVEDVKRTFGFANFPFYCSRSYLDDHSFWGFAQAETAGDIALAIDEVWRMLIKYLKLSLLPPIIIPKDTGLDKSKFAYIERLVLQPNSGQTADGIRFLQIPAPPSWLFQVLDLLLMFFGRVGQIEDVDRGDAPTGIVAASAIQMLQERAAVLVRAKIRAIDSIVRNRGRWLISFKQNFGVEPEWITIAGTPVQFRGIDFLAENFIYKVESGSTIIKTEAEEREMATQLFQLGAIDQRALLESVKFRGYREVLERMADGDILDKAAEIFVQAGMAPELMAQLVQFAREAQGGPGNDAMVTGGNSMAQNNQPMAAGSGAGSGSGAGANMRGKSPQMQNGGAPSKPGVPMVDQNG